MKFYYEFKGKRLSQTECYSYQEAQNILFKIVNQCILSYRQRKRKKMLGHEELRLQAKILSKLKLVRDEKHGNLQADA